MAQQIQGVLNSTTIIEQATGVLAERFSVTLDEALEALRSHVRNHNLRLTEVAAVVVAGALPPSVLLQRWLGLLRLMFENETAGYDSRAYIREHPAQPCQQWRGRLPGSHVYSWRTEFGLLPSCVEVLQQARLSGNLSRFKEFAEADGETGAWREILSSTHRRSERSRASAVIDHRSALSR
ncbi:MAG: ANTAR domain-containing protein [Actinomycetia bacterium]|nr:ANTAR domain-containing protein [Actinomycetes bacterium]